MKMRMSRTLGFTHRKRLRNAPSARLSALLLEDRLVPAINVTVFQEGVDAGFGIYTGTKDTKVYEFVNPLAVPPIDGPNTNYGPASTPGTNDPMLIDWTDAGTPNASHGLLRFDNLFGNNPGQIPLGSIIVSAALEITTHNPGDGGAFHRMKLDWVDSTVTWNSSGNGTNGFNLTPGIQADGVEAEAAFSSFAGWSDRAQDMPSGPASINVTEDLQAWSNSTPNYGWGILPWTSGTDGWSFETSESASLAVRPRLIVNWTTPIQAKASFQEGVAGYAGTVDTAVRDATPTLDNSAALTVAVDAPAGNNDHGLLRFDNLIGINPGQIPPGSKIEGATLKFTTIGSNAQGDGGSLHRMLIPWNETANWNDTASGLNGWNSTAGIQPDGVEAAVNFTTAIGNPPTLNPNYANWSLPVDVTADIQAWADGQPNHGWGIISWQVGVNTAGPGNGTDGWFFRSSEDTTVSQRPVLTVYYTPQPVAGPSATLDVVAGQAIYVGGDGKSNNVTLALSGGNYSIEDSLETIALTPAALAAGWTGNGTNKVTGADTATTSLLISLGKNADTFTMTGIADPITVVGGSNVGDIVNFPVSLTYGGFVDIQGFDVATQTSGTTLEINDLSIAANAIGSASNRLQTKTGKLALLGVTTGVWATEADGTNLTFSATGSGTIDVANKLGTLAVSGKSKSGTGDIVLSSADAIAINAKIGDATTTGKITIAANSDGVGFEGFSIGALGGIVTGSVDAAAFVLTVNTAGGGTGNATTGAITVGNSGILTINVHGGSIIGNGLVALQAGGNVEPPVGEVRLITTGSTSAIGTSAVPVVVATGTISAEAGTGGVYLLEAAAQPTIVAKAVAQGTGEIFIDTANLADNGLWITGPINTGSGIITLLSNDDFKMMAGGSIGGPAYSGKIFIDVNQDAGNQQFFGQEAATPIQTTNAAADAVVIQISATSTGSVGGAVLGNIKVGGGGGISIDAAFNRGVGSDSIRAGVVRMFDASVELDAGPTGSITLKARDNSIGESTVPIKAIAGQVLAMTGYADPAATNRSDADIYISTQGAAAFSAITTDEGTFIGDINLTTQAGDLTLFGDVKTATGFLTLNTPGNITQTGGIVATTGGLNLNYVGLATFTSLNNSAPALTVSPGNTVIVDGSFTPTTAVGVDGVLKGKGTVGAVTVNATGEVAPGTSPGVLTTGNLAMTAGSKFTVELTGVGAGVGYDQLNLNGTVDLGGATLNASLGFTPPGGSKYVIINNDGSDTVTNTFNGLAEGGNVVIGSTTFTISYQGGDGNDVVLTAPGVAAPPPTISGPITINGGSQRSMVQSITITFSEPVTLQPGAFKVEGTALGPIGNVGLNVAQLGNVVTLTFNNTGVAIDPAASLADGKYKLTIAADKITGGGGATLDGNSNGAAQGSPTDDVTFNFHRLFGDVTGDGAVTALDFNAFRLEYGTNGASIFDFDGSGGVTAGDFNAFRLRYGSTGYLP